MASPKTRDRRREKATRNRPDGEANDGPISRQEV